MASLKAADLNHPASEASSASLDSAALAFALDSNALNSLNSATAPPYYSPGSEGFQASLLSPGFGGSNDDEDSLLNRLGFSGSPTSPPYPNAADGLGGAVGAAGGGAGDGRERGAAGETWGEASGGASVLGGAGAWAGEGGSGGGGGGGGGASFAGLQRAGMLSREQLMAFFRAFTALLDSKEARAQIKSSVQEGKSASSVTRLLREQVLLDMGIEPQFGMTCLRAVPLDYREDRDMVLRICHMHAREEAACDEAELTPLALAQKKMQTQLMQQHQLTVLQHVRMLPVDEQRAFLQSVQGSVQQAQEQRAQGKERPLNPRLPLGATLNLLLLILPPHPPKISPPLLLLRLRPPYPALCARSSSPSLLPHVDDTEPLFAEAARQMALTGDWVTPQFNAHPRFDKPPLSYWLTGAALKSLGGGALLGGAGGAGGGVAGAEAAAAAAAAAEVAALRVPSALCLSFTLALLSLTALRFGLPQPHTHPHSPPQKQQQEQESPFQKPPSPRPLHWAAAFTIAPIFALSLGPFLWGSVAVSDAPFLATTATANLAFFWAYASHHPHHPHDPHHSPHNPPSHHPSHRSSHDVTPPHSPPRSFLSPALYLLSALSLAAACLTKGPLGALLPCLVLSLFLTLSGTFSLRSPFALLSSLRSFLLFELPFFPCALLFLLTALPWFLAMGKRHGSMYLSTFFGYHHWERFAKGVNHHGNRPVLYPLLACLLLYFPWSLLFPPAFLRTATAAARAVMDRYGWRGVAEQHRETGMRGKVIGGGMRSEEAGEEARQETIQGRTQGDKERGREERGMERGREERGMERGREERGMERGREERGNNLVLLGLAWVLAGFGLLALSRSQLPSYYLPMAPASVFSLLSLALALLPLLLQQPMIGDPKAAAIVAAIIRDGLHWHASVLFAAAATACTAVAALAAATGKVSSPLASPSSSSPPSRSSPSSSPSFSPSPSSPHSPSPNLPRLLHLSPISPLLFIHAALVLLLLPLFLRPSLLIADSVLQRPSRDLALTAAASLQPPSQQHAHSVLEGLAARVRAQREKTGEGSGLKNGKGIGERSGEGSREGSGESRGVEGGRVESVLVLAEEHHVKALLALPSYQGTIVARQPGYALLRLRIRSHSRSDV
ncbi:unnamed protein product [Closterium sp. NIES-65]|nr:unnamed protein product [Closterium sp. NIES-65]